VQSPSQSHFSVDLGAVRHTEPALAFKLLASKHSPDRMGPQSCHSKRSDPTNVFTLLTEWHSTTHEQKLPIHEHSKICVNRKLSYMLLQLTAALPSLPTNATDAILWLMNDNGLLWATKEDGFHPLIFGAAGCTNCVPHPIEKSFWDVSLFL
jgi:hypothetical protein